jgi:hypothetical protein
MAQHAYIASFEESDGFTCDHVLHGPSLSEVEREATIDARQRNATLVAVRPAVVGDQRGHRLRRGVARVAALAVPAALLAAVILLIQSSASA